MTRTGKRIAASEVKAKLRPIITGLMIEGRKSAFAVNPAAVRKHGQELADCLDQWSADDKEPVP